MKYEVKQFRNIFRVIDTTSKRSITKDIPDRETADEIAADFNEMDGGNVETIAGYSEVHANAPKQPKFKKSDDPIENIVLMVMPSLPGIPKEQVRKRVLHVTSPAFFESIGIDKTGPQNAKESMFLQIKIVHAMLVNID
jgi:hypothetical protein